MTKKTNLSLAVLGILTLLCGISSAHATDASLAPQFLGTLEGHWEGHGADRSINLDGSSAVTPYTFDLQLDSDTGVDSGTVWNAQNSLTTDQGVTRVSSTQFSVRNGMLFVSTNSGTEPVQPIESTAKSLTYKMQRVDAFTGRVFDFTFHDELLDPDTLRGETIIQLNGVTIEDDQFQAKRW